MIVMLVLLQLLGEIQHVKLACNNLSLRPIMTFAFLPHGLFAMPW